MRGTSGRPRGAAAALLIASLFGAAAVAALVPQPALADTVAASSWAELRTAFNSALGAGQSRTVVVGDDFGNAAGQGLVVPAGESRTLDLNGHGLTIDLSATAHATGILVDAGTSLTIADGGAAGTGHLVVRGGAAGVDDGGPGIGTSYGTGHTGGSIAIAGGWVEATGGWQAAGIGGANDSQAGPVTISGGLVSATGGGNGAAGIGGGWTGGPNTITVQASAFGAGNATDGGSGANGAGGTIIAAGTPGTHYTASASQGAATIAVGRVLSFQENGGSAVADQFVPEAGPGTTTSAPAPPTRSGFAFVRWAADPALTTPFAFGQRLPADATAYAAWHTTTSTMSCAPLVDGAAIHLRCVRATAGDDVWTVPDAVTAVVATVTGAEGGHSVGACGGFGYPAGQAARLTVPLAVTPGDVLDVWTGASGANGFCGGSGSGGGGGSFVASEGALLVAAGGGGGTGSYLRADFGGNANPTGTGGGHGAPDPGGGGTGGGAGGTGGGDGATAIASGGKGWANGGAGGAASGWSGGGGGGYSGGGGGGVWSTGASGDWWGYGGGGGSYSVATPTSAVVVPGAYGNVPGSVSLDYEAVAQSPSAGVTIGSGDALTDLVTLRGEPGAGTVAFRLYGPDDAACADAPAYSADLPSTGSGTYAPSGLVPTAPGDYRWVVGYSRSGGGFDATTSCAAAPLATVAAGAPGAPGGLGATPADGSVALAWTAPAGDGGSPITDYTIEYRADGTGLWQTSAHPASTGTSRTVAGLANGTPYEFRVTAINDIGAGPASAVASATPRTNPGAVAVGPATPGDRSVALRWTAPPSDGGSAITDYTVEFRAGDAGGWRPSPHAASAATARTVTGLSNGVRYEFRITAINAVGPGPLSAVVPATPRTVPAAPALAPASPGDGRVVLAWTPPADDGGDDVDDYVVEVREAASPALSAATSDWTPLADPVTGTTTTVTGLVNGAAVELRVAARNDAGTGAASPVVTATPRTVPGAPRLVEARPGDGRVELAWSAPSSDGGAPLTAYRVESSRGGARWETVATTTAPPATGVATRQGPPTAVVVEGLADGVERSFRVIAQNVAGSGAPSNALAATPAAPGAVALAPAAADAPPAPARGGADSPSFLTTPLPTPASVLEHPERIAVGVAISLVWILLLTFVVRTVDESLKRRYASWSGSFQRRFPRIAAASSGVVRWISGSSVPALVVAFVVGVLLMAVIEPEFGWNAETLRLLASTALAVLVTTFVARIVAGVVGRLAWRASVRLRASGWGIVIGLLGVLLGRGLAFVPGLLEGSSLELEPRRRMPERTFVRIEVLRAWISLGIAIAGWIGTSLVPVAGLAGEGGQEGAAEGSVWGLLLLHDALAAMALGGLGSLLADLLPLPALLGGKLWSHARGSWVALVIAVAAAFAVIVVPAATNWLEVEDAGRWVAIAIVAGLTAVVVVAVVNWRHRRERLAGAAEDEGD